MKKEKQKKEKDAGLIGRMVQNIKDGDRVIWIIVLLLSMFSLVAIFSSTSLLAIKEKVSRLDIFAGQLKVVAFSGLILILSTAISNIRFFRGISRGCFLLTLLLLLMLDCHVSIGTMVKTLTINGATRAIRVGGFSVQVFEVAKVAMVMYLAWAIQAYERGNFPVTDALAGKWPALFGWLKSPRAQRWVYIFIPIMVTTGLIFPGSTGSALLTAIVMFVTILIGGIKWKDLLGPLALCILCLAVMVGIHIFSNGQLLDRTQTAFNRLKIELPYPDPQVRQKQKDKIAIKKVDPASLVPGTAEFKKYLDEIRQPAAAEIALVKGARNIVGKGPGKSTQKYVVPVMFEDYMFSFIVEEYGLITGFIIIIMYLSLFARGAIIVHNCNNRYAKACVGGLVFLITFQAMFHVLVNCNVGILTGQTLPLISHGRCSFLCFAVAFSVILCISKIANLSIKAQQEEEAKKMEMDDIEFSVNMVEDL